MDSKHRVGNRWIRFTRFHNGTKGIANSLERTGHDCRTQEAGADLPECADHRRHIFRRNGCDIEVESSETVHLNIYQRRRDPCVTIAGVYFMNCLNAPVREDDFGRRVIEKCTSTELHTLV